MIPRRPLPIRLAAAARNQLRRLTRPLWRPVRDRQAPGLHRFMMHEAAVPGAATDQTALIVAPHHDDETFGCGGVIALKRAANVEVQIVILTDGRQSHGNLPVAESDRLARTRNGEVLSALDALGVDPKDVHALGLPDQGLRSLAPPDRAAAVETLTRLIIHHRPGEIFVTHRHDRHPDHEAAYRLTVDAIRQSGLDVRLLQYPIWLIWLGPVRLRLKPAELAGAVRIDVRAVQPKKNKAIDAFQSQLPVLPPGFVKQFQQGYEVFFTDA